MLFRSDQGQTEAEKTGTEASEKDASGLLVKGEMQAAFVTENGVKTTAQEDGQAESRSETESETQSEVTAAAQEDGRSETITETQSDVTADAQESEQQAAEEQAEASVEDTGKT